MKAENPLRPGDTLTLTPPLPELPPPFWETPVFWYATGAGILVALLLVISGIALRRRLRRPPEPETPALAALGRDGSPAGVTRALRAYLARRIPEAREGLTTGELARLAAPAITPEWIALLRECDDAKFAGASAPADLAARAGKLVETAGRSFREAASR